MFRSALMTKEHGNRRFVGAINIGVSEQTKYMQYNLGLDLCLVCRLGALERL